MNQDRRERLRTRRRSGRCVRPRPAPKPQLVPCLEAHSVEEMPVDILNRLLNTLQQSSIAGPQLFRLDKEFSYSLGQGGEGNVRGLDPDLEAKYSRTHKRIRTTWAVRRIAIKQHMWRETKLQQKGKPTLTQKQLCERFRAAESEVLALAPGLFRDHPNITRLLGWGLCLDTMEDPSSPCCGGLQLPLLIFERAEHDLAQFLLRLFPQARHGEAESWAEQGLADSEYACQEESGCLPGLSRRVRLSDWTCMVRDPYNIVRVLCLDVGHGLEYIHRHDFTHGDIKPENVLVYREAHGWTAKLSDFGCAVGKGQVGGMSYSGTDCWPPPLSERISVGSFQNLLKCDIFVYGLLVWSSFCLRGEPPVRPNLRGALLSMDELSNSHASSILGFTSDKSWIFSQVRKLLQVTLEANNPELRPLNPWSLLYRHPSDGTGQQGIPGLSTTQAFDHHVPEIDLSHLSLPVSTKAKYKEQAWWDTQGAGSKLPRDASFPRLASTEVLHSDDNCISNSLFTGERRRREAQSLARAMVALLETKRGDSSLQQEGRQALYYYSRFRSRVPLDPSWWGLRHTSKDGNFVRLALEADPPIDTNTLAWLCAGPIGRAEVQALDGDFETWASIVDPGGRRARLDDSARLDRFLLLLQSGAHVEYPIRTSPYRVSWSPSGTVLSAFIKSCRAEILPTAISEIYDRFDRAYEEGHMSTTTLMYLYEYTHADTAFKDLEPGQGDNLEAIARLTLMQSISDNSRSSVTTNLDNATEREPLLHQSTERTAKLPPGWKTVINKQEHSGLSCYEDEFSRSVTLTRPSISPIAMHQAQVGHLSEPPIGELVCHLDLLSCLRSGDNEADQLELEKDLHDRFPYYDDAWYAEEWDKEPNTDDVLGRIWMPWRISTFAQFFQTTKGEEITRGAIIMVFVTVTLPPTGYIVFRLSGKSEATKFCTYAVFSTIIFHIVGLHMRGVWNAWNLLRILK